MGNHTEQLSGGMTDCLSGLGQSYRERWALRGQDTSFRGVAVATRPLTKEFHLKLTKG